MIRPKITILKKSAIGEPLPHATAEKSVKGLKKPGIRSNPQSTNPFLRKTFSWTNKSPRERLHLRARELTLLAGHAPLDMTQEDYEQAKREVTGETILMPATHPHALNAVTRFKMIRTMIRSET